MIMQNACLWGTQRCEFGLTLKLYDFSESFFSLHFGPSVIHLFIIKVQAEELVASSLSCLAQSASDTGCGNPTIKFQQVKYHEP